MTKALVPAALAVSVAASLITFAADPAAAHYRRHHRAVVAAAVVEAPVAGGCGSWFTSGCGVRTCRPAAYYDMAYPYAFASMTPSFGLRARPIRTCW